MTVEWQTSPDPGLRHPILVVAFEGWFDVARAATGAVQWLVDQFEATPLAAVDPEPYFDFTTRRPLVKMQNGWQLTHLPTRSPRAGVRGRAISSGREFVQRSLHPLPAQQSEFNLAVNRIVTHLLHVTARQAAAIERLEAQVDARSAPRSDF